MRKVLLEQGSQNWLDWRRSLLTATDAAMLLGKSPYVTPYKGWQRKIGEAPEQEVNSAMLRGVRDEPIARAKFIEKYGINMIPCCIESDLYNFLGASLDGISDCGKFILEIKSQNVDQIKSKGIPEFHMFQMQHQLLCTDGTAEKCFYTTIWENEIFTLEVLPNLEWMAEYIPKAKEFWKIIVFKEAPPLSSKDYKFMDNDALWNFNAIKYKEVCSEIKQLEEKKEKYKNDLINLCEEQNAVGAGIKLLKKTFIGRIDFSEAIKQLQIKQDLLETYRKPSSTSWTIMIDEK